MGTGLAASICTCGQRLATKPAIADIGPRLTSRNPRFRLDLRCGLGDNGRTGKRLDQLAVNTHTFHIGKMVTKSGSGVEVGREP